MMEKKTQDVITFIIKSDSSISKMVTKCLRVLHPESPNTATASPVEIIADAKVSGKAITITEIVKRRITEHGGKINQVTRVQAKPDPEDVPAMTHRSTHLQGEGYGKSRKNTKVQMIIRLDTGDVEDLK